MEAHFDSDVPFERTLAVVSFPTTGLPGVIASQFLVEKLELPLVGSLHSENLPPLILARRGQWEPPIAIYGKDLACGPDGMCDGVLVVTSTAPLDGPVVWEAAKTMLDAFAERGAQLVTVLESVAVEETEKQEQVFALTTGEAAERMAEQLNLPRFQEGVMGGVSSALLVEARRRGMDVLVLIGEAHEGHPDHRCAARLTQIVNEELMGTKLDLEPLDREAAKIEGEIRKMRRRALLTEQKTRDASVSMYR